MDTLIAAGAPGLESALTAELTDLGFLKPRLFTAAADAGGRVEFPGGPAELMRANLLLRTADRVWMRLGRFTAKDMAELERGASLLPWERYLKAGRALSVKARCRRSKLFHEGQVADGVGKAVGVRLKAKLPAGAGDDAQGVSVTVQDDIVTVDLDSSGAPLSRRGWRQATAKAPLKETLAASLLWASGWAGRGTLLDPFCGSGTIVIEAALAALRQAPGLGREFAFMRWPGYDEGAWRRVAAGARSTPLTPLPRLVASDRDAGAVEAAKANAERAGVADMIEFSVRALSDAPSLPGPGWLVTNPPYGVRVSEGKDLRALYSSLGNVARGLGADWTVTMLCADQNLARATGLPFDAGLSTLNGGLSVRVMTARPR